MTEAVKTLSQHSAAHFGWSQVSGRLVAPMGQFADFSISLNPNLKLFIVVFRIETSLCNIVTA